MAQPRKPVDSRLSAAFANLSKPAQRALLNHQIFTENDLSKWKRDDIAKLHRIRPASFPVFDQALADAKLKFRQK